MRSFQPGSKIILDPVGQYYASIIEPRFPGSYTVAAYLKQPIDPHVLQQAVDDLFRRLPFLNGRLRKGFFWYWHEILKNPPKIVPDIQGAPFTDYYNRSRGEGHVVRVLYGEKHLKIEAIHSIIDGRSVTAIIRGLVVRYFERLGIPVSKSDILDCSEPLQPEEGENAFARYGNPAGYKPAKESKTVEAYQHKGSTPCPTYVTRLHFDLSKIKAAAKQYETTVNGYVLAHLLEAIAEERDGRGAKEPIIVMMPIDCRGFIPTKTYRNFVMAADITMPEAMGFAGKIACLGEQFQAVNQEFVQNEVDMAQSWYYKSRFLPRLLKKALLRILESMESKSMTTTFSNIGLVRFPKEIEAFVDFMEFVISQDGWPYSFGCISHGNVLTITITASVTGDGIAESLTKRLGASAMR